MMRRVLLLVTASTMLVSLVGCGKSSQSVTASDATGSIVQALRLPDDVKPCLVNAFDASPSARHALDPDKAPSDADLDALSRVVTGCVPAATFAKSVSAQMANGYRAVADIPPDKEACLREQMAQLSDDDRGLFVTGPIIRLRDPTSQRSLAVNDVLSRLLNACGIDISASPPTTPTSG